MMYAGGGTGESMDLNKLLDIINNADTYTARLQELKNAEKRVTEAGDRLITCKSVAEAVERAKVAESTALVALKVAREEATKTIETAKAEAQKVKDDSLSEIEGLEIDITSKRRELSDLVDRLAVTKQELLLENSLKQKISEESQRIKAEADALSFDIRRKRELIETL